MTPLKKHERDVRHLFQRLPEPVPSPILSPNSGWPTSAAHWSGAIGSTTTFDPIGMLATIQSRASMRVSALASTRSLWTLNTRPCRSTSEASAGSAKRQRTRVASATIP